MAFTDLQDFIVAEFHLEETPWTASLGMLEVKRDLYLAKRAEQQAHLRWLSAPPLPLPDACACKRCGVRMTAAYRGREKTLCAPCFVDHRREYRREKQKAQTAKRSAKRAELRAKKQKGIK